MTPQPHQNPDVAALEAQWWKDWWAADYSWDGLAKKPFDRVAAEAAKSGLLPIPPMPATVLSLATIWRDEEPHLIPEPGTNRRWTRAHCPLVFADGTPSPKARWTAEEWQVLADSLPKYRSSGLICLNGIVAPLPDQWPDDWTVLLPQAYLTRTFELPAIDVFAAGAWLPGVYARGEAGRVALSKATITGRTAVNQAAFTGLACDGALFIGDVYARRMTVATQGDFSGARFAGRADFSEAVFAQHANFEGVRFAGAVDFFGVHFLNRALFDNVHCLEEIGFYKAAFVRRLTVNDAEFFGRVNLEGATEGDPIAQSPQTLRLLANDDQKGLTGTLDAAHGPSERSFKSLPKLHARRTVFHEDANLSNRDLLSPSTLRQAVFQERARFHGSDLHANVNFHGARFRDALSYRPGATPKYPDDLLRLRFLSQPAADFRTWKKDYVKARIAARQTDFTLDGYFESLEASFRTLKQMMEDRRDRVREGEFFNLELRARRKRGDVPWWERVASYLYWGISDYGNSIFRPLAVLLVLYVSLSLTYFAMGDHENLLAPALKIDTAHLFSAFGFAWNNVFSPFSVLDPQRFSGGDTWAHDLVFSPDAGFNFRIKVLATLQSLLSLTLAFLAGLAGRRRFQIN